MVRRYPFVHPVRVRRDGEGDAERLWAVDVSPGGIFVRTPRPYHAGTRVQVFAEVEGAPVPLAWGEVAWRRTLGQADREGRLPGFGVKFDEVDPNGRALIEEAENRIKQGIPIPLDPEALAPTVKSPSRSHERRTQHSRAHREPTSWVSQMLYGFVALGTAAALGLGLLWFERHVRPFSPTKPVIAPAPAPSGVAPSVAPANVVTEPVAPAEEPAAAPSSPTTPVEPQAPQAMGGEVDGEFDAQGNAIGVSEPGQEQGAEPEADVLGAAEVERAQDSDAEVSGETVGAAAAAVDSIVRSAATGHPHEVALPSGAVKTIRFTEHGDTLDIALELAGPFAVSRAFSLRNPAQIVLDVAGAVPREHGILEAGDGVERIEVLAQSGDRTRLKLLLTRPVERIQAGDTGVVAYLEPKTVAQ